MSSISSQHSSSDGPAAQSHSPRPSASLSPSIASPVGTERPSLGQVLADKFADLQHVKHMQRRAYGLRFKSDDHRRRYRRLDDQMERLEETVEHLLHVNAAHRLDWCHDSSTCEICQGTVTL